GEIARSGYRAIRPWACRAAGPAVDCGRPAAPRRWALLLSPRSETRRAPAEIAAHAGDRRQNPAPGRTFRGTPQAAPSIPRGRFQDRAAATGQLAAILETAGTCRRHSVDSEWSTGETGPSAS